MPAKVLVGRDSPHSASFPNGETLEIKRSFNGLFLLNIILGGIPGMIVDIATGAVNNQLSPGKAHYEDGQVYPGRSSAKKKKKSGSSPGL